MIATWKDDYCTGHALVDAQHREIFQLVNQFAEAVGARRAHALVRPVLDRLIGYVEEHFAEEERLMRRACFPGAAQHARLHRDFRAKVEELVQAYRQGDLVLPLTLSQFLLEWLREHIQVEDLTLVRWLREEAAHGTAPTPAALPAARHAGLHR